LDYRHLRRIATDLVFIRSIGAKLNVCKATNIQHDEKGDEIVTLKVLWKCCHETEYTPWRKSCLSSQNMGSFHRLEKNDLLRKWLTRAVRSEDCASMPLYCLAYVPGFFSF
jgi:hypothetical protein